MSSVCNKSEHHRHDTTGETMKIIKTATGCGAISRKIKFCAERVQCHMEMI